MKDKNMTSKHTLKGAKMPLTAQEAWVKYPKLNWLYHTHRLMEFQKIEWTPFATDEASVALESNSLHSGTLMISNELTHSVNTRVYIEEMIDAHDTRNKIDIVVHKGVIVEEIHYTESSYGHIIKRDSSSIAGKIELLMQSLIAWHFDKFSGIVSFEYVDGIIIAVRLTVHPKAKEFYPDHVLRNLNGLYTKKKWVKPKELVT